MSRPKEKYFKVRVSGIRGEYWLVFTDTILADAKHTAYELLDFGVEKLVGEVLLTTKVFVKDIRPFKDSPYYQAYRVFT